MAKQQQVYYHVRLQGGGGGVRGSGPTPDKSQNIGFLSNTGPLKFYKATEPAFNLGPSSARQGNAV